MRDVAELVKQLKAGEERAWRDLMSQYGRLPFAVAYRFHLGEEDRAEIFQMTFMEAFRSIGSLRDPSKLGSWLYGIARHSTLRLIKRAPKEISAEVLGDGYLDRVEGEFADPEETLVQLELSNQIREGLTALDSPCRSLLQALYMVEPPSSYTEISERLGIPIGSIGPTRARCLEKLKRALRRVSEPKMRGTKGLAGENPDTGDPRTGR